MNSTSQIPESPKSRIQRNGGRLILQAEAFSQLLSSLIGPVLGVYFILATTNLSSHQLWLFAVAMVIGIVVVNGIHFIYAAFATRKARGYLDYLCKNKPLGEENTNLAAWNELSLFPRRSTTAQFFLIYGLIILPVILYMRAVVGINNSQLVYIAVGGTLSAFMVVAESFLFLDNQLAPARQLLLPADISKQIIHVALSQRGRQFIVTMVLLLMAIIMVGGVSYQKISAMFTPGADQAGIFALFKLQVIIMALAILLIGTILAIRMSLAVSEPTREIIHVMDRLKLGDYTQRAQIYTSDDMAQLTIRFNQMIGQLQNNQLSLESQVQERTSTLEQRSKQLQAAAQVAREATSLQDLNTILSRTVNLISEQFGFYHAGIFLLDEANEYAILQAASSDGGKNMLARGHRLAVGTEGIVGSAAYHSRARIAMDVGADREYFNNPDLPMTRSEAAIPLIVRNKVIGILDIQSSEENKFMASDIEVLQILADQIALAIQNARLISESQDAIQRLEAITSEGLRRTWQSRVRIGRHAYRFSSAGLAQVSQADVSSSTSGNKVAYLDVPINLRGQKIGAISLHRKGETAWTDSDLSLVNEISTQVGLALENARLVQDSQQKAEREKALSQVTARIRETLDLDVVLQTAVREIKQTFNLDKAEIRLQLADQSKNEPQSRQP